MYRQYCKKIKCGKIEIGLTEMKLVNISKCLKGRGILRTQSNIYDRNFLQKQLTAFKYSSTFQAQSCSLLAVNYFHKKALLYMFHSVLNKHLKGTLTETLHHSNLPKSIDSASKSY